MKYPSVNSYIWSIYLLQESKLWRCNSSVAPKQTELGRAEQDVEVVASPNAFTNFVVITEFMSGNNEICR